MHIHTPACTCFIIPSSMLRKLAVQADEAERQHLLEQMERSAFLRGQRAASGLAAPGLQVAPGVKHRTVYDAHHKTRLPGKLVRTETAAPVADTAVNEAFDGAGATYDFYLQILHRNSIDGRGLGIDSSVHYSKSFNNAFWNGRQMVYGDGDGKLFTGFTHALDVIAHELTHGVTQYTVPGGGLVYDGQSGALNESVSDVFGSIVKQWHLKQTVRKADWLIGAGIMTPAVGKALRSMADPGNTALTWSGDDQPGTMAGYVDGGDVHTNSGISNHAFYLAAMKLGGHSWDKAGPIWYQALPLLHPDATFADAAQATAKAAELRHGVGSAEAAAVRGAWHEVGVV
ncbi:M4 family metallopeptidase [Massilia luteola]|uniref:M4 family metallopeptidase n=1 Tax=Massilia luteola TaxID=3081751 RepID=UPI002ACBFC10|nr:M4 family metallopeptidase [Massilia sp. Gc5]